MNILLFSSNGDHFFPSILPSLNLSLNSSCKAPEFFCLCVFYTLFSYWVLRYAVKNVQNTTAVTCALLVNQQQLWDSLISTSPGMNQWSKGGGGAHLGPVFFHQEHKYVIPEERRDFSPLDNRVESQSHMNHDHTSKKALIKEQLAFAMCSKHALMGRFVRFT